MTDDARQVARTVGIAAVGAAIGYTLKQRRRIIIDLNGSLADQEDDRS